MQLVGGQIRATGANISGYWLFRSRRRSDRSRSADRGGRVLCSVAAANGAEIAQSRGGLRASIRAPRKPASTAGSAGTGAGRFQLPWQRTGGDRARRSAGKLHHEKGVKVEWPEYEEGTEHLEYFIAGGKPKHDLELPFYTIWRTTAALARKSPARSPPVPAKRPSNRGRAAERLAADRRRS